jgi:hypothetical protein
MYRDHDQCHWRISGVCMGCKTLCNCVHLAHINIVELGIVLAVVVRVTVWHIFEIEHSEEGGVS